MCAKSSETRLPVTILGARASYRYAYGAHVRDDGPWRAMSIGPELAGAFIQKSHKGARPNRRPAAQLLVGCQIDDS